MKVNFITEITGFYRFIKTRHLSSNAQLLWFKLFCLWNEAGFPDWLQVDMKRMTLMIQVNSRSTAERARNELITASRIICSRGKSRQPNCYQFVLFGSPARPTAITQAKAGDQMIPQPNHQTAHQNTYQKWHQTANQMATVTQTADHREDHNRHQDEHEPLPLYKLNHTKPEVKKEKNAYGQFGQVLLSDQELAMLQDDFPDNWEDWIRRLDLGKEARNYVYSNDYAAIHSWQERDDNNARDQDFQELMTEAELFCD